MCKNAEEKIHASSSADMQIQRGVVGLRFLRLQRKVVKIPYLAAICAAPNKDISHHKERGLSLHGKPIAQMCPRTNIRTSTHLELVISQSRKQYETMLCPLKRMRCMMPLPAHANMETASQVRTIDQKGYIMYMSSFKYQRGLLINRAKIVCRMWTVC